MIMLMFNKLKKVGVQSRYLRHILLGRVVLTHNLEHRDYGVMGYYFTYDNEGVSEERFVLDSDALLREYKGGGKVLL